METKDTLTGALLASLIIGGSMLGFFLFNLFNIQPEQDFEGYIFIDSMGRKVFIPNKPEKIVSMAPSITEILFALEVDDRVVGVTDYCNYPVEVSSKPSIGGFSTPDLEVLVSLDPDLILSAAWNADSTAVLEELGYPIVIILAETLGEIINNIGVIADLTDANNKGLEIVTDLKLEMEEITNETDTLAEEEKLNCYFEIWETPKVAGGTSYLDDMISKAGALNIFGTLDLEWPTVSHEWIIAENPEVIFISEHSAPWYSQEVSERNGYDVVNACIEDRIFKCFDDIFLRAGPRIIMALENMTHYLYPSLLI